MLWGSRVGRTTKLVALLLVSHPLPLSASAPPVLIEVAVELALALRSSDCPLLQTGSGAGAVSGTLAAVPQPSRSETSGLVASVALVPPGSSKRQRVRRQPDLTIPDNSCTKCYNMTIIVTFGNITIQCNV